MCLALYYRLLNRVYVTNNLELFAAGDAYLVLRSVHGIQVFGFFFRQVVLRCVQISKPVLLLDEQRTATPADQVSLLNVRWVRAIKGEKQGGSISKSPCRCRNDSGNAFYSCRENHGLTTWHSK